MNRDVCRRLVVIWTNLCQADMYGVVGLTGCIFVTNTDDHRPGTTSRSQIQYRQGEIGGTRCSRRKRGDWCGREAGTEGLDVRHDRRRDVVALIADLNLHGKV